MSNKNILTTLIAVIASALALTAVGCGSTPEAEILPIKIKGALSETGTHSVSGTQALWGIEAAVKWVNETHGGVMVNGEAHLLEFSSTDDESTAAKVTEIMSGICDDSEVDFVVAPYSSGLTTTAVVETEACDKLLLDHGGAADSIFVNDYENIVQFLTPGSAYHRGIFDLLEAAAPATALNIAFLYESDSFSLSVATAARGYVTDFGHTLVFDDTYPQGADRTDATLQDGVAALALTNPDIVLGGGHTVDSEAVAEYLASNGVSAQAVSLLGAAGSDFYQVVQPCPDPCTYSTHPAEGISGPGQWEIGVTYSEAKATAAGGTWFGPSQAQYETLFTAAAGAGNDPSYRSAEAAQTILGLTLAIEKANSLEVAAVRSAFATLEFTSFFGDFAIDSTGKQTAHKMIEYQWQEGEKVIVGPDDAKTDDHLYPMP